MIEKIRLIKMGLNQLEVKGRRNMTTLLGCMQELDELEETALEQERGNEGKAEEGGGANG